MKQTHLILLTGLFITCQVNAAEFCVASSAELQIALDIAANNSQHDVIRLTEGIYPTPGTEFSYDGNDNSDLEVSGGWTDALGVPCGQQINGNAYNTVLDGVHTNRVMRIEVQGTADITLSSLLFGNGFVDQPGGAGAGLFVYSFQNSHMGNITVEKTAFLNNESNVGGATSIRGGNQINMRNNLFAANKSSSGMTIDISQDDTYGVFFTNNTVVFNQSDSITLGSGLRISISDFSQGLIANNIFYDNQHVDLILANTGNYYLYHNNIGNQTGVSPVAAANNISLPNRFEPGILNFTPSIISPLVNQGIEPCSICPLPVPFDESWILGMTDLLGGMRLLNGQVDIGAFESPFEPDLIFMNVFQ